MIDKGLTICINHEDWQWQTTQTKFCHATPNTFYRRCVTKTYSGKAHTPHNPFPRSGFPTHSRAFLN